MSEPKGRSGWLAGIGTAALLLLLSFFAFFFLLVALNGVSERQGPVAIGIWLVLQILLVASLGAASGWGAKALAAKYPLQRGWMALLSVLAGTLLGVPLFLVTMILSVILAGIK